ncbi:uncharacterized protein LOC130817824 [Amaranthus tricolor]|uniref:uncharacterized protein LOC130817824 n=1 Tax=Amaranthus tricolor TaxID=29722 RepID=UPI00258E5C55|nr:uncharacterized protein LOC130817824 [Amaranthus tricolor]
MTQNVCHNCNSGDHWILHNDLRNRANPLKLCTSCVLKLHLTSFCPTCFNLHDPNSLNPPPCLSSSSSNNRTLTCLKCNSISHITCVPPNTPKSPYLCFLCSNPNFKLFDFKKPRKSQSNNGSEPGLVSGSGSEAENRQVIDEKAARILTLAARITKISMNKVVVQSSSEAERKVRESALAKKRAKEAIDYVMSISSKFNNIKPKKVINNNVVVPVLAPDPAPNLNPIKVEKIGGVCNGGVDQVSNGNGPVAMAVESNGGSNENLNHIGKECE